MKSKRQNISETEAMILACVMPFPTQHWLDRNKAAKSVINKSFQFGIEFAIAPGESRGASSTADLRRKLLIAKHGGYWRGNKVVGASRDGKALYDDSDTHVEHKKEIEDYCVEALDEWTAIWYNKSLDRMQKHDRMQNVADRLKRECWSWSNLSCMTRLDNNKKHRSKHS